MSNDNFNDLEAFEYQVDARETGYSKKARPNAEKKATPAMGRKRGKTPQSFNGIHRRRRRKVAW